MMYRSYKEEEINVINSYTTDGQLQVYDVRVLEDDLIMNGKVDNDGMRLDVVAKEFLQESGLIN